MGRQLHDKQDLKFGGSTDGDMSGDLTSDAVNMDGQSTQAFSFFLDWTGDPSGEFSIEGSVDGTNWFTLVAAADMPDPTPGGSPASAGGVVSAAPVNSIRVLYTRTSGSGTLTGHVGAKAS